MKSKDARAKCKGCGGDIVKTHRVEGEGEDEEYIPIARCLNCGNEYDQYTQEYYEYFSDEFIHDRENTVFKLGLKGELKGVEYEIIGRMRYQDEEEYEIETWDEWLAISSDGVYHWFVEEEGVIYSYEEYIPESIDLETDSAYIEFEGKRISREDKGFVARIVYAEGELPWKPEIGEPVQQYEFKKDGFNFAIEQYVDEVSITRGERIPHRDIIEAFRASDYLEVYESTMQKRKRFKTKSVVYMTGIILSMAYILWALFSGSFVKDIRKNKIVIAENELKVEEGSRAFLSQVLYGPVELDRRNSLYEIRVNVDERVQSFHIEWQSYRVMLIKEERLTGALAGKVVLSVKLRNVLDEIDALENPLESFVFSGDFWDEEGYDGDGYWHESDTDSEKDFVLDDAGRYFIYLELFSQKQRFIDSVHVAIVKDVKSYRYFVIAIVLLMILFAINRSKSKTYNELPFDMAAY
jgi:hypothetical protein